MGMFNFLKKIIKKDEVEENKERISFSDIENWIEKKGKENEIKEKEIFSLIDNKINVFIDELKEKINVLKGIDVESKKAEDKFKSITNEGRKKYLEAIEIFIGNLEKLEKDNLEKFIENINKIFLNFNKSSHMSYERATILIGKEMENIKENVRVFSKDMIKIFDENRNIVDFSVMLSLVKIKLNKIDEIEYELKKINNTNINLIEKINKKEEENKRIIEEIEKIKKSPEYLENLEREKNIKFLEEELEKDILGLKQIIDFKALSNFFHIFEREMQIVKLHREDFQTNFKKDYGESILNLLNEAKLNNETISEKIKQIKSKKEEIEKNKREIKKDETQKLYPETTRIILEIGNLNNEKERGEKRKEKLNISKDVIIKEIREEMGKVEMVVE